MIETMNVNTADKSISIDGEAYICGDEFPIVDPNLCSLHWHPNRQGRCKGSASYHVGGMQALNEFSQFEPFIEAWKAAKERTLTLKAMDRAEAQGAFDPEPEPVVPEDEPLALQALAVASPEVPAPPITGEDVSKHFTGQFGELAELVREGLQQLQQELAQVKDRLSTVELWCLCDEAANDPAPTTSKHVRVANLLGISSKLDGNAEAWRAKISAFKESTR